MSINSGKGAGDYQNLTEGLLEEKIPYEVAIQALTVIAEGKMFEEWEDRYWKTGNAYIIDTKNKVTKKRWFDEEHLFYGVFNIDFTYLGFWILHKNNIINIELL